VWAFLKDRRLSPRARRVFTSQTDRLHVSMISLWELSIKITIGKLRTVGSSIAYFRDECQEHGIQLVPLKFDHILRAEALPFHHRDPFDRLIIAQALEEGFPVVSNDPLFKKYGVNVVW
jgi:PIN domain nuclease of toxin-antitoxin system